MKQPIEIAKNLCLLLAKKPTPTRMKPEDWDDVYEIASSQWLIGSLGLAIQSLPDDKKPPQEQLVNITQEVLSFQIQREKDLAENIALLNSELSEYGPLLWVKGADDLLQGVSNPPGNRWMMDIDVVIPENKIKQAWKKLIDSNYHIHESENPDENFSWESPFWHHAPTVVRNGDNIAAEVHRYIFRYNTRDFFPEDVFLQNSKTVTDKNGNRCLVLEALPLIEHRILHMLTELHGIKEKSFNLRDAFHLFLYIQKHRNEIDWSLIQTKLIEFKYEKELRRAVFLLGFLFDEKTPLYNEHCSIGQAYVNSINKTHRASLLSYSGAIGLIILGAVQSFFSPQLVAHSYQKQPSSIIEWVKAYAYRVYKAIRVLTSFKRLRVYFRVHSGKNW